MIQCTNGDLFAGTLFGLFHNNSITHQWEKVNLPVKDEQITALIEVEGRLMVMTRSYLLQSNELTGENLSKQLTFTEIILPQPVGYDNRASLFKTLWVIHSGEIYGTVGKLVIDLLGILIILLTVTGIIHFLAPHFMV